MEQRSQSKVAMAYGAMYGIASSIIGLIFWFAHADVESKSPQWLSYILLVIFIVMGVKSYRDQELGGFISYGKSLGTGVLIGFFGGIITAFFTVLLFTVIDPTLTERLIEKIQEKWAEKGMSEDQIAVALSWTKRMMSPIFLFLFAIIGSVFMSFLFSLIISIFMRKEPNPFQTGSHTMETPNVNPAP